MSHSTATEEYFRSINAYVKRLETTRLIDLREALVAYADGTEVTSASGKPSKKNVKK